MDRNSLCIARPPVGGQLSTGCPVLQIPRPPLRLLFLLLCALCVVTLATADAQTKFEYTYGDHIDKGHATVECTSCDPAGFISVGRTRVVDIDEGDTTVHDDVYIDANRRYSGRLIINE